MGEKRCSAGGSVSENSGDCGPGRDRHGDCPPGALRIQHEGPGSGSQAAAKAGVCRGAAGARLVDGDGASGRRADECRPANERDAPHVQRVGLSQHEAVVLFHQRVARRPGGPGSPCQGAQRRLDPGRRPGCDNA
ncbi:MAG: hypothetical protein DMG08_04780, partial [Acidobacteria bacterium]